MFACPARRCYVHIRVEADSHVSKECFILFVSVAILAQAIWICLACYYDFAGVNFENHFLKYFEFLLAHGHEP